MAAEFGVTNLATVKQLADEYRPVFQRSGENKWAHIRKVTPGDYLEKLHPTTIRHLDHIFEDTLERLGY